MTINKKEKRKRISSVSQLTVVGEITSRKIMAVAQYSLIFLALAACQETRADTYASISGWLHKETYRTGSISQQLKRNGFIKEIPEAKANAAHPVESIATAQGGYWVVVMPNKKNGKTSDVVTQ